MRHGWVGGVCKPCADNKCAPQQCLNDRLCGGYGQMGDCYPGQGCAPSSYGCSFDNRGPGQFVFTDGTPWDRVRFRGDGFGGGVWACNRHGCKNMLYLSMFNKMQWNALFLIKYSTYIGNGISGIFYIHGLRNHNRCPGGDGGTPAGVRGNGNSGTGQPYLLINFEPWLRASPAQYGNKKFAPGKWDDQHDRGYPWVWSHRNHDEIPFRHGRWGNGYFCQICVKGGCENMVHLPYPH